MNAQGRKVYGEEARRVLAGQDGAEGEEEQGAPADPPKAVEDQGPADRVESETIGTLPEDIQGVTGRFVDAVNQNADAYVEQQGLGACAPVSWLLAREYRAAGYDAELLLSFYQGKDSHYVVILHADEGDTIVDTTNFFEEGVSTVVREGDEQWDKYTGDRWEFWEDDFNQVDGMVYDQEDIDFWIQRLTGMRGKLLVPREKSLTARVIPPKDAIAGLRRVEDQLAAKLRLRLDKAARDFRRMAGRRPSAIELRTLTADIAAGLQEEFARLGGQYVGRAYRLGLEEEKDLGVSFGARDRTEVRRLQDDPQFLKGRLSKVVEDATGTISEEIRAALEEGESTLVAAQRAADLLGEEAWKVERIVRSDTTNVANAGRMTQFEKRGRPGDQYGIVSARDRRRCPICKAADDGIDTLTTEERTEFDRSEYDPALFHGNPYTLVEIKTFWQVHNSFHGNCRCTVRRHVALS